jgi:hypothetical protein
MVGRSGQRGVNLFHFVSIPHSNTYVEISTIDRSVHQNGQGQQKFTVVHGSLEVRLFGTKSIDARIYRSRAVVVEHV